MLDGLLFVLTASQEKSKKIALTPLWKNGISSPLPKIQKPSYIPFEIKEVSHFLLYVQS